MRQVPSPGRDRLGAQRADVGAGLGLGEVHRARPLAATPCLRQVALLLLLAAVVRQHLDGPLGEQRAQREGHVGGRQQLLHHDRDQPREATAAVLRGERDAPPPGVDVLLVRGRPKPGGVVTTRSRRRGSTRRCRRRGRAVRAPRRRSGRTPRARRARCRRRRARARAASPGRAGRPGARVRSADREGVPRTQRPCAER